MTQLNKVGPASASHVTGPPASTPDDADVGAARAVSVQGRAALATHRHELERLLARIDAPVTARMTWLEIWAAHHPRWEPWVIAVRGDDRVLEAAALLAFRRRGPFAEVVLLGHGPSDRACLPALSRSAAARLAAEIDAGLGALRRPWRLRLRQLPADDPVACELARCLPRHRFVHGLGSPRVRFDEGRSLAAHASRNYRSQAKHKWNQLERAGASPTLIISRDPGEIADRLPEVMRVCRQRDIEIAGQSPLDDAAYRSFFESLILAHAQRDEIELTVLLASDRVAAYSLAFLDGRAYRQWNKHLDSEWGQFKPGQVLDHRLLQRLLAEAEFDELDWMAGEEAYKLRTATDTVAASTLLAWSSPVIRALDTTEILMDRLRPFVIARPALSRAHQRVRAARIRARQWRRGSSR